MQPLFRHISLNISIFVPAYNGNYLNLKQLINKNMKQFYMLFAALTLGFSAFAQLPDGSTAPDFTATDIDGNEWNLYTLLDEGNTVILDFYATWCGPCWSYAESGALEEIYAAFGPNGTGDVYVFALEADDTTTEDDLNGTGGATIGDWTALLNMPIIDNAGSIFDDYAGAYYPTIYTVCPDYTLTESGQATFEQHISTAFAPCDNDITGPAPLMSYNGDTSACGGSDWVATTEVSNLGSDVVTAMTLAVELNGSAQPDVVWSGNLASGGSEVVNLGTYSETGTLDVTLVEVNGEDWEAHQTIDVVGSVESTTYVQVRIRTDNWPEESSWSIQDSNGNNIAGVNSYSEADTEFVYDVALDLNECYTFTMIDSYGDGLYASQWGNYEDGYAQIVNMDGEAELNFVLDYQGSSGVEWSELIIGIEATETTDVDNEVATPESFVNVYPNPFNGNTNLTFTASEAGNATIVVYNLVGERVIDMNLGSVIAGTQTVPLDFTSLNAGIYLLSVTAANETSTLRVTNTH